MLEKKKKRKQQLLVGVRLGQDLAGRSTGEFSKEMEMYLDRDMWVHSDAFIDFIKQYT